MRLCKRFSLISSWTVRALATASPARSLARCLASHFIRLRTAWSTRCAVTALSPAATPDADISVVSADNQICQRRRRLSELPSRKRTIARSPDSRANSSSSFLFFLLLPFTFSFLLLVLNEVSRWQLNMMRSLLALARQDRLLRFGLQVQE